MNAALLLAGFLLMCFLPLLPGLVEILRPRDRYPLPVDLLYAKDPRYLGNSLRALLDKALAAVEPTPAAGESVLRLELSRTEAVRVAAGDRTLEAGETCPEVLAVQGGLLAAAGAVCEREVRVRGAVRLGDGVRLRALAGDRDVRLGQGVEVLRWLDANGDLAAGADCRLGKHCAAGGMLTLSDGCRFMRLFGETITTPGGSSRLVSLARGPRSAPPAANERRGRTIDEVLQYEPGDLQIAAGQTVASDLLVRGDLAVAAGAVLAGCVRVHGAVRLGRDVLVEGSLFADGPIILGAGATVAGNVFGQDTIEVGPGVQIGRRGAVKSLIGNRGIVLRDQVVVHGYILTENEGVVRCTAG